MLTGNYALLYDQLTKIIDSKRLITNPLQLLAYGTDASVYRLIPKLAIWVHSEQELIQILRLTNKYKTPVTFRAAGTSLSGQAISDSVLLIATHKWKNFKVIDDGNLISLQPGVIGGVANNILRPYGRKIGPDPASINAAMIGGIVANNASGMCCGTAENSYKTLSDIRLVMYDGTILDTADKSSVKNFMEVHKELIQEIESIRNQIKDDKSLTERIKTKYKIKNTTGYSLNSFVDYHDPIDIIKHLIVGSEGTLAFISNVTYETVVEERYKACAFIIFDSISSACQAIPLLKETPVSAVELLDRASIRSVENDKDAPSYFKTLPETACALLVECQAHEIRIMNQKQRTVNDALMNAPTLLPYWFTANPREYEFNWRTRKGLLSTVGGLRKTGTSCIIEDVAFPVEVLADAALAIQALFRKYNYTDAVLFGHALEGNLHLTFSQDFGTKEEVERYGKLMDELADIVVNQFDGSLKAEHGTGRNMAPFVEKEWGEIAYLLMKRLKKAFDPNGLINPGVIINESPLAHLENLKPLHPAHELIDKCMECGFCESSCVSEGFTLSPRQRIVIAREIAALTESGEDPDGLVMLKRDAKYFFDATCATDGLCAKACPVHIDTGKFVKQQRFYDNSKRANKTAAFFGKRMAGTTSWGRTGLNTVNFFHSLLGSSAMGAITTGLRVVAEDLVPRWNKEMPKAAQRIKGDNVDLLREHKVIYFPSCINRTMGKSKSYGKDEVELTKKTEELLIRAGYSIIYPKDIDKLCCGMAFSSKGFKEEGARKRKELENALREVSNNGEIPVLFDMSPCFYTFIEGFKDKDFKVYDPIEFMYEHVMPKLEVKKKKEEAVIFPVCSVKKIDMEEKLYELSLMCAEKVIMVESNCCGFAGDRGFTYPELNAHGLRNLRDQLPEGCKEGYSTSRTCEIGMSEQAQANFKSIFYLIDEVTR